MTRTTTSYPPAQHLLRDLRISVERGADTVTGLLDVGPVIADASGRPRMGAVATLVDVVAGEMAIRAALPSWTATSDLSLQVDELPSRGRLEATPRVLRSGRQTIVLEVLLRDGGAAREVGLATVGFAILPARSDFQKGRHWAEEPEARTEFGLPGSGFTKPLLDSIGLRCDAERPDVARIDITPYLHNSLGALQGGAVATLLEATAERFAATTLEKQVRVRSLSIHFLKLCRVGPIRAEARSIARTPGGLLLRVELYDEGADDELRAVATIQVDESSALPSS